MFDEHETVLHPRPQLTREGWVDLCGPWGFAHDDDDVGLADGWETQPERFARQITVPFPPESPASGVAERGYHPVVWYRRAFMAEPDANGQRLLLHFGAVDYRARVWVNGVPVAAHEGGHTPFFCDITGALRPGGEQVVVVRAEDRPLDVAQPRGKQDWELEPHAIWYHRTTGIWQPVWLEWVNPLHISEVRWTPDVAANMLRLRVTLGRAPARPLRLRVRLSLRGMPLADDEYAVERDEVQRAIVLEPHALGFGMGAERLHWSPEQPNLIDAELCLYDGDRLLDRVGSYAGLRSAGVADGRFLLNGRPYYPRLVLAQGYWPESHLAAPDDEALCREVALAKSLGFNGLRVHQKVEDPRFLYWCDRLGMLVWGEMANAFAFTPTAVERLTREWLEVLRRDYSHPCIVTWVPINESWGVPDLAHDRAQRQFVQAIYSLTRALDPTRPIIGNDGWEHVASDIWGVHDYATEPAVLRTRYGTAEAVARSVRDLQPSHRALVLADCAPAGQPVMLSECGGVTLARQSGQPWFGYGEVADADRFLEQYAALLGAVLDCETIAGFCYTQLTDTEQETNGLLTAERLPKLDPLAVRAITSRPSKSIPGDLALSMLAAAGVLAFGGPRTGGD